MNEEKEIHEKHRFIVCKQASKYNLVQLEAYEKGIEHATAYITELIEFHQLNQLSELTENEFQEFMRKKMTDSNS